MTDTQKSVGVIGEGREQGTSQQPPALVADTPPHQPPNICVDLFGHYIHKPIPRHSPLCTLEECPSRRKNTTENHFVHGSPWRETSKDLSPWSTWESGRSCPDDEDLPEEDYERFRSKFKDLKALWEREEAEVAAPEPAAASASGGSFDDCSLDVKMFFINYALTNTVGSTNVPNRVG